MTDTDLVLQCQECGRQEKASTVIDEEWRYLKAEGIPLLCPQCLAGAEFPEDTGDRGFVNDAKEFPDGI